MYYFKNELKTKLLKGRKINYVADGIGINKTYLYNILNGKKEPSKVVAYSIVKFCDSESEIRDYFEIK
jgi:hypothetical protein